MRLHHLHLENIFSYRVADFKLADRGLLLIRGEVQGSASTNSNGAGKSALLPESLLLGLFGRPLRSIRKEATTHFLQGRGLVVLSGETERGRAFRLTRPIRHPDIPRVQLELDGAGLLVGEDAVKEVLQSEILGPVSFSTFVASSVFSEVGLFTKMDDVARKKIFEELLDLEAIGAAYDRTKAATSALEQQRKQLQATASRFEGEENTIQQFIAVEESRVASLEAAHKNRVQEVKKQRKALEQQAANATTKAHECAVQSASFESQLTKQVAIWRELQKEIYECERQNKIAAQEVATTHAQVKSAKQRVEKADALQAVCAECEQNIPAQRKQSLLAAHSKVLLQVEDAYQVATSNYAKLQTRFSALKQRDIAISDTVQKIQASITSAQIEHSGLMQRRASLYDEIERMMLQQSTSDIHTAVEGARQALKDAKSALADVRKRQLQTGLEIEELEFQITKRYGFWLQGFGTRGLKTWRIEEALPFINQRIAYYSSVLTDNELQVAIRPFITTGSGEERAKIAIEVTTPYATQEYEQCSRGQKCRVDLMTTLALGDFAATRCPFPIRFAIFDELFDPLDSVGVDRALKLLDAMIPLRENIFVISHSPLVQEHFANEVVVTLTPGGYSVLSDPAG